MTYRILKALGHFIRMLPDAWVVALARCLAFLCFDVFRVRRRLVVSNIATAFPDRQDHEDMARRSFFHFLLTVFEFVSGDSQTAAETVTFEGEEHLQNLPNGAYILCAHLGNWEVLAAAVNTRLIPTRVIVKTLSNKGAQRFVAEQRAAIGMDVIVRKKRLDAVKAVRKAIANGHVVGFVLDQRRKGEPRLEFFGRPATTNTGLASLSQRFVAPIIPVRIERLAFNRHKVVIAPPLPPLEPPGPNDFFTDDIARRTQQFNHALEELIRHCPEQYFWLHNRWK